jgi:hypothetical protein
MPARCGVLISVFSDEAGGSRIQAAEQLIGGYRLFAAVLKRTPGDRHAREGFHTTEKLHRAELA